ncbi:MAG: hypothetical protein JNK82_23120 [Myxococcaceae bacterium]|nr:hypothetical protein [Myxococcaceae bacterium]
MGRINAGKAVAELKTQFKRVEKQEKIQIDAIPNKRLREFARDVAGGRTISSGCGGSYVPNKSITPARLKKAIGKVEADIKKADKNKDNFITPTEGKALSQTAKDLLNYTPAQPARPHRPTNVYSGC